MNAPVHVDEVQPNPFPIAIQKHPQGLPAPIGAHAETRQPACVDAEINVFAQYVMSTFPDRLKLDKYEIVPVLTIPRARDCEVMSGAQHLLRQW